MAPERTNMSGTTSAVKTAAGTKRSPFWTMRGKLTCENSRIMVPAKVSSVMAIAAVRDRPAATMAAPQIIPKVAKPGRTARQALAPARNGSIWSERMRGTWIRRWPG